MEEVPQARGPDTLYEFAVGHPGRVSPFFLLYIGEKEPVLSIRGVAFDPSKRGVAWPRREGGGQNGIA